MASNAPPFAQSNLEIIIRKFIPKELIPPTWYYQKVVTRNEKVEIDLNMWNIYIEGQPQLGMFDSQHELKKDIGRYFSFPKRMEYFNLDPEDPFEPNLYEYKTAYEQKGIYKADLYRIYDFRESYPLKEKEDFNLTHAILTDCWKKLLDDANHYEMIVCPGRPKLMTTLIWNSQAFKSPVLSHKLENFMKNWEKRSHPKIKEMSGFILKSMRENYKGTSLLKDSVAIAKVITYCGLVMENIAEFAKDGSISLPSLNNIKRTKQVIRVFLVGSQKVVMADELRKSCEDHGIDIGEFKEKAEELQKLSTFQYDKVFNKVWNKEIVIIEKNQLLMFAQTPIPYDGGYCILAADALYELLIDMIVAKKVFQDILKNDWEEIKKFFNSMKFYFDVNRGIYFLDLEQLDVIKTMWEYAYNHRLTKKSSSNAKQILETKGNGYSVKDLEGTLESLGLEASFKDIKDYAEPIYSKLIADRESERAARCDAKDIHLVNGLSLADLHFAVILCQINCVVSEVPKLLEFIHNQKSCDRMTIVGCQFCDEEAALGGMTNLRISKKKNKNKNKQNKNKTKRNN